MPTIGCTHRKVTTYVFVDGNAPAGLWACADCGHKFEPVNLIVEKDAERYRLIRQDHEGAVLPDLALYAGRALDDYIDAAIAGMPAVGAG
jgi:hypothetical protein